MANYSSRDLKTIIKKIQTEADAINFLVINNEGFNVEEYRCEIQLHFMVIKQCTKLIEKMFSTKNKI